MGKQVLLKMSLQGEIEKVTKEEGEETTNQGKNKWERLHSQELFLKESEGCLTGLVGGTCNS